jgi:protein TonB
VTSSSPIFGARPQRLGLAGAFIGAALLHAGALALILRSDGRPPAEPPGTPEIIIDLTPASQSAENVAGAETPPKQEPIAEAEKPPEPEPPETPTPPPEPEPVVGPTPPTLPAPETQAAAVIETKAVEAPVAAPVVPPVPTPAPPRIVEKPGPMVKPKPVAKPKPVEKAPAKPAREAAARPHRSVGAPEKSTPSAGGVSAMAAADPNAMSRYAAQLAAALRARLAYPENARSQGATGTAVLRFTLHRSGQVTAASLTQSTGNSTLDQAALATARPGSALPAAPDNLPQASFTFAIPLRFTLR